MDSTEFNQYRPRDPRLFELPKIISLKMKLVDFKAPKLKTFTSRLSKYKRAVVITIVTEGPIPIRDISPTIYIGNIPSKHSEESKGTNEYKFYVFNFEKIKPGERILWGWANDPPAKRMVTGYTFDINEK
jgi:hypothetical protein